MCTGSGAGEGTRPGPGDEVGEYLPSVGQAAEKASGLSHATRQALPDTGTRLPAALPRTGRGAWLELRGSSSEWGRVFGKLFRPSALTNA